MEGVIKSAKEMWPAFSVTRIVVDDLHAVIIPSTASMASEIAEVKVTVVPSAEISAPFQVQTVLSSAKRLIREMPC